MLGGLQGLSVGSPPSKCAPLHRQRSPAQEHHLLVHLQGAGQDAGRGDGQHPPRHLRLRHAGELHGGQGVGGFPPRRAQGLHRDRVPPGRSPLSPPLGSWGYPGCAGTGCFGVGARGAGVLGDVVVPGAVATPCHRSFATWQEPTFGVRGAVEGAAGSVGAARNGCVGARCAPRLGHGSGRGVPLRGVSSVGSHGPRPPRWPCSPCGTSKWWCW